jgi:hypothetical protein
MCGGPAHFEARRRDAQQEHCNTSGGDAIFILFSYQHVTVPIFSVSRLDGRLMPHHGPFIDGRHAGLEINQASQIHNLEIYK